MLTIFLLTTKHIFNDINTEKLSQDQVLTQNAQEHKIKLILNTIKHG